MTSPWRTSVRDHELSRIRRWLMSPHVTSVTTTCHRKMSREQRGSVPILAPGQRRKAKDPAPRSAARPLSPRAGAKMAAQKSTSRESDDLSARFQQPQRECAETTPKPHIAPNRPKSPKTPQRLSRANSGASESPIWSMRAAPARSTVCSCARLNLSSTRRQPKEERKTKEEKRRSNPVDCRRLEKGCKGTRG